MSLQESLEFIESFKEKEFTLMEFNSLREAFKTLTTFGLELENLKELINEMKDWSFFNDLDQIVRLDGEMKDYDVYLLFLETLVPTIHQKYQDFEKLSSLILSETGLPNLIVIDFATELLLRNELSTLDLALFTHRDVIEKMLFSVYEHHNDQDLVNGCLSFLFAMHWQIMKKPGESSSVVFDVLTGPSVMDKRKEISLGIVFLFNRAENTKIQESITDLLEEIFKKEPHYFYTNDSIVLFDITMRQVMRVHDDQVSLRHGLMTLLPLILDSIPLESPGGAYSNLKVQMVQKLSLISSSTITPAATKMLAQRMLSETKI